MAIIPLGCRGGQIGVGGADHACGDTPRSDTLLVGGMQDVSIRESDGNVERLRINWSP